jgi:trigger factor
VIDTTEFFGPTGGQADEAAADDSDEDSTEAADEVPADAK